MLKDKIKIRCLGDSSLELIKKDNQIIRINMINKGSISYLNANKRNIDKIINELNKLKEEL